MDGGGQGGPSLVARTSGFDSTQRLYVTVIHMKHSLLLLALCASTASAADFVVAPSESIQAAIDLASAGDRILVQPGTYLERIDFTGKAIEVIGLEGPGQTTIDAAGDHPVVRCASGEGAATRLQGFTIRGGNATASSGAGGIVCLSGATPTVEDCIVRDNSGKFGGGISGSPILRRCVVLDNRASLTHGGGIYGAPQMSQCVVASNTATSADGGGLYLTGGSSLIEDCVIVENSAVFANSSGGGVAIHSSASATFRNTLIAGNFATGGAFVGVGGGIFCGSASSVLENCTVVDNSVSGSSTLGAGFWGALTVRNSTVRDNLGGPDVSNPGSISYSNIGGGWAGVGNVDLDPSYIDSVTRDYHLSADSPLIDIGDPLLLDDDGTRSDVGAFPYQSLYTRANTQVASWSAPAWTQISQVGGSQQLVTQAGAERAGAFYTVLGSLGGTTPGFTLLGAQIPLNPDFYTALTLGGNGPLVAASGMLDAEGAAVSTLSIGPRLPALAGLSAWHATGVLELSTLNVLFVTNAERVDFVD